MTKTNAGRFFEDYRIGQVIDHAVPRTVGAGERALYHALYPARHALHSSDEFARACGLPQAPLDDLAAFHVIFGKTVPDVSLNAVANLGYAQGRWRAQVYAGDTLRSSSEVIGLKENSSRTSGVVYVRTRGTNQRGEIVMDYVRWVMVRKRDAEAAAPETVVPELKRALTVADLAIPAGLTFAKYDFAQAGEPHRLGDYAVGEVIDHVDGVTIEEAEHMMATRLWQNTAKVHFDATGLIVQWAGKRSDDCGPEWRGACQSVFLWRYGSSVVGGVGHSRDFGSERWGDPVAAGRDQGGCGRSEKCRGQVFAGSFA
jgi:2-methylfumaryl-CoA hydratase